MSTFVNWHSSDVFEALDKIGFEHTNPDSPYEMMFERKVEAWPTIVVRIYSSVSPGAIHARGNGKDAGRVVLIRKLEGGKERVMWKAKRVHRTKNFLVNLVQRAREAYKRICPDKCPMCQGPMVLRKPPAGARWNEFWSCMAFPKCKGTRRMG